MKKYTITIVLSLISLTLSFAQESILTGLKSKMQRADAFYSNFHYQEALELYLGVYPHQNENVDLEVRIANTYYNLKNSGQAIMWYERAFQQKGNMKSKDLLRFAMALTEEGLHVKAENMYRLYTKYYESNEEIEKKLQASKQPHLFFKDSSGYLVKKTFINTNGFDFSPAFYNNGIVFVSSRTDAASIKKKNTFSDENYLRLYYSQFEQGGSSMSRKALGSPTLMKVGDFPQLHEGPTSFSSDGNVAYLTRNLPTKKLKKNDEVNLGIYISYKSSKGWSKPEPFSLNNPNYSVGHPSLSEDGNTLYFISDMPGGFGGTDIYKIEKKGGNWTAPINLGEKVNTSGNEMFPFIHRNFDLYFASNGHGGLGGLDIFKTKVAETVIKEAKNLGYPVNTNKDDFGLVLDPMGVSGYFSSNRTEGSQNDNIYSLHVRNDQLNKFELFVINGNIQQYPSIYEQVNPEPVSGTSVMVVDAVSLDVVGKAKTDIQGNFCIKVPYSGEFILIAQEEHFGTHKSSFTIPDSGSYEGEFQINFFQKKYEDRIEEQKQVISLGN